MAETASLVRRTTLAAVRTTVPAAPGMTAAESVNGLPVASTTRTPGGISRRNSPAGTGSLPMPLSSYHDAGLSPANEISRSRHPSSASTIASAGKDGSGAACQPSPSEDTLSWYARRPR